MFALVYYAAKLLLNPVPLLIDVSVSNLQKKTPKNTEQRLDIVGGTSEIGVRNKAPNKIVSMSFFMINIVL